MFFHIADQILNNYNKYPHNDFTYSLSPTSLEEVLSASKLKQLQEEYNDVAVSTDLKDNDSRISFDRHAATTALENLDIEKDFEGDPPYFNDIDFLPLIRLSQRLSKKFGSRFFVSGLFWYPYRGYCGWHTNSNVKGTRIYYVWAAEDDKSFFRYQNPDTGEVVTRVEKAGWQINKFAPNRAKPLWHCVGSSTNRFSIGFNFQGDPRLLDEI